MLALTQKVPVHFKLNNPDFSTTVGVVNFELQQTHNDTIDPVT